MTLQVTLVQGGGIGLDQVPAVKHVLSAAGVPIEWDEYLAGWASLERGGVALPAELLQSVRATGLALKTKLLPPPSPYPLPHDGGEGRVRGEAPGPNRKEAGNFNVQFRRELGLFASVRPLKNLPGLSARFSGVDMLVIRELTEDLYAAIEHEIVPGVVQSIKVVTEAACRRFFRFAFEWTRRAGRKSVACVHKANILKLADGLFLDSFRSAAQEFPELQTREIIVDNCCMQMVSRPQQFDVLVMGNLYGDLVSDLGAGVVGGVSATAGINVGDGVRVYESFHGGSREMIGENRANPLPLLLPAIDLLEGVGEQTAAQRIADAVGRVLTERRAVTPDLGGTATTMGMAEAVVAALA
jgi:isocitrate dehydrogenase (NAD+)